MRAPILQGARRYDFAKFSQKLHEIERIWTPGGASLAPPEIRHWLWRFYIEFNSEKNQIYTLVISNTHTLHNCIILVFFWNEKLRKMYQSPYERTDVLQKCKWLILKSTENWKQNSVFSLFICCIFTINLNHPFTLKSIKYKLFHLSPAFLFDQFSSFYRFVWALLWNLSGWQLWLLLIQECNW